jgi:hypothetical protein
VKGVTSRSAGAHFHPVKRWISVAVAVALFAAPGGAQDVPVVSVVVRPGPADHNGFIGFIDVAITVPDAGAPAGAPLFSMAHILANGETAAKTLRFDEVRDSLGSFTLTPRDTGGMRHWMSDRAVSGALAIRYRVPIDNAPPAFGTGPPLGVRTEGRAFSGAGTGFLLVPAGQRRLRHAVKFDLAALGPDASAVTIFGDGDVRLDDPGVFGRLTRSFYMVGQLRRHPAHGRSGGFSAAWLDPVAFDARALMAWTDSLYGWYMKFFGADTIRPYRVFLRYNPINPWGGVALPNAFVATHDQKTPSGDELKVTLAHEMLHTQLAGIAQWFSEGVAVYYARILPWRAGLLTADDFVADLNEHAARYYTNALNTTPNDQVEPRFWEDTRIRTIPYDRGSFYLAVVDGRIRKASQGKRSLDDVALAVVERNRRGQPTNEAGLIEMFVQEYGQLARTDYEAMIAGKPQVPESDGFGPCFRRVTRPFRRFELGFDSKILAERERIVRGVIPGSGAERAGLRNGDVITVPVALDRVQGKEKLSITYHVRRGERVFPVTYFPRGETVDTYQWERVPGVGDSSCRL